MVTKSRLRIFNKDLCLSQTKRKRRQERNDSKNEKYGSELLLGNYYNIALNYIDLNGIEQTKGADESYLIPTGQTTAVSNIYDMGGNLYEYTTEKNINGTYPYVSRGGGFGMIDNYPAGYRGFNSGKSEKYHGFRVALYLKVIE